MSLSKEAVRANIVADMTKRFPARHGDFPDKLKLASLGFPSAESRREWGKAMNKAPWFTGWFTPSEFLACVTVGPVPNSTDPNLVDLMFNTQTRPPEHPTALEATLSLSVGAPAATGAEAKKAKKAKKVARPEKPMSKVAKATKKAKKRKGRKS